ncbi:MAG: hypothetical protein CVU87_08400 [Firmicutes bacterium HGW-Firmicutes-12]|jgi:hypothetical protein|nr:MAG: hypothetical protein CVU87_08400 [Firmicutes bacterium HGW-Firmicutes-12]
MHDITIRSVLAGMVSVIFKDLFDILYINLGFSGVSMIKVAAGTFITVDTFSYIGLLIGLFAHYIVGGIIGLSFTHYLCLTNKSHPILKGLFSGLVAWLFLAGMLLKFGISNYDPIDELSNFMLLIDHIIFGITMGFLNKMFVLKNSTN